MMLLLLSILLVVLFLILFFLVLSCRSIRHCYHSITTSTASSSTPLEDENEEK